MDLFILYVLSFFLFWSLLLTPQLVQNTRQKLFNIRDKAFLDMEHNEEYRDFRDMINALIRFAHHISWQRLLFDFIVFRKEIKQVKTEFSFNNDKLNQYFLDGVMLVIRLIYLRSPVLILLSMPLVLVVVIKLEILPQLKNKLSAFVMKDANIYTYVKQ